VDADRHRILWGADGGQAEADDRAGLGFFHLVEFLPGAFEADLDAFDFAGPALGVRLVEAGLKIVDDLKQAGHLLGLCPQQRASDTGVLVLAGASVGAGADAELDFAPLEISLHLVKSGRSMSLKPRR
jgi:hypothetical protein